MFVVFDQRFLDRFGFITYRSGQPVPDWLTRRDTVPELAGTLSVDPERRPSYPGTFDNSRAVTEFG